MKVFGLYAIVNNLAHDVADFERAHVIVGPIVKWQRGLNSFYFAWKLHSYVYFLYILASCFFTS